MRFLGGGVGHTQAPPPQTRTDEDAQMDLDDEAEWDIYHDSAETQDEPSQRQESESGSDDNQTDGDETDPELDDGEDSEGDFTDDDGFAAY